MEVVQCVAKQIGFAPATFTRYVRLTDGRSRRRHVADVVDHAGWRACGRGEWKALGDWLTARVLEHDTPSVLFRQALEQLQGERVVRPGLDRLMRAVATARVTAQDEIRRRLEPQLTPQRCDLLDALVVTDAELGVAPLVWLNTGATSASPEWAKTEVAKLVYLEGLGAHRLDLSVIPPERLRRLATVARRSTPRALRQMAPERRHPILLAALAAAHSEIIDETVRLFDMILATTDAKARDRVAERRLQVAGLAVDRLALLDAILDVVLDDALDDTAVGAAVRALGPERLSGAARSFDERPPRDGGHLELMEARFAHVRSFAPQVLAALSFAASVAPSEVLDAVVLLQAMNAEGRRHLPEDAPAEFVPLRWRSYLDEARAAGEENRRKHYWELCVLFALPGRAAFRGDLGDGLEALCQPLLLPHRPRGVAGPTWRSAGAHGHAHHLRRAPGRHRGGDGALPGRSRGASRRARRARPHGRRRPAPAEPAQRRGARRIGGGPT